MRGNKKTYLVGGAVRDALLGVRSKDLDYVVTGCESFDDLCVYVENIGCQIVVKTPQYGTVRCVHATKGGLDFALPRIDHSHTGRHCETSVAHTIEEDLARRDFTMNAIARLCDDTLSTTGQWIDPFGGVSDIHKNIIRFVGDPVDRIAEDELRILRALRFQVTKRMMLDLATHNAIAQHDLSDSVSNERIFEELNKMFNVSNTRTIQALSLAGQIQILDRIKLKATT